MNAFAVPLSKTKIAAGLAAAALCIGWMAFSEGGKSDVPQSAPSKPIVDSDLASLQAQFNANSIAFAQRFKGKRLRISSTVAGVTGEDYGPVIIVTDDGQDAYPAHFSKDARIAKLAPGDSVTFVCGEFDNGVLDDCSLVR